MLHPSEPRLSVCNGCCCGHVEKGNPAINVDGVKRAAREAGLPDSSLSFPYCLGPCAYANVVRVDASGQSWMFARINDDEIRAEVMAFAKAPNEGNLSARLRERQIREE